MLTFPCAFQGILTLSLSWTLLEIPLNLSGLVSIEDVHFKMDGQFISLCAVNRAASMLPVSECVREISARLDEMVSERCQDYPTSGTTPQHNAGSAGSASDSSLLWFRRKVARVLELPTHEWTLKDLDARQGWISGRYDDPLDHCGSAVWGETEGSVRAETEDEEVWVVGQFLAIDRDFLLRDVIGCLPRVRYCISSEAEREKVQGMLSYELRRRHAAWEQWGVKTNVSVGTCEPPQSEPVPTTGNKTQTKRHHRVVLVRNLNRWGDPSNADERNPVKNILEPLIDLWRPAVFVHLSEEVAREPADEMERAYSKAGLVLRPYYHYHSPEFKAMLHRLKDKVVIMPLGYGQGSHNAAGTHQEEDTGGQLPASNIARLSGITAALAWISDDTEVDQGVGLGEEEKGGPHAVDRDHTWAFVGRLGVHSSRTAMVNVFSNAPIEWGPHIRAIDRGGAFAGGDKPPFTPTEVALAYQRAMFVPSPPGNSPDCFRTYEGVVNGALPLLDGRPNDYPWWRSYYGNDGDDDSGSELTCQGADIHGRDVDTISCYPSQSSTECEESANPCNANDGAGIGPFPAPLGYSFAWEDEESIAERHLRDEAGFDQVQYAKVRKRSLDHGSDEGAWRSLLRRALAMGTEERRLRQDLNARWYVGTLTEIRRKVQGAFGNPARGGRLK